MCKPSVSLLHSPSILCCFKTPALVIPHPLPALCFLMSIETLLEKNTKSGWLVLLFICDHKRKTICYFCYIFHSSRKLFCSSPLQKLYSSFLLPHSQLMTSLILTEKIEALRRRLPALFTTRSTHLAASVSTSSSPPAVVGLCFLPLPTSSPFSILSFGCFSTHEFVCSILAITLSLPPPLHY